MPRFRKRPVIIDAVRLKHRVIIEGPIGHRVGNPGDWLITGVADQRYFCDDDIFHATYEPVSDEARDMMEGE